MAGHIEIKPIFRGMVMDSETRGHLQAFLGSLGRLNAAGGHAFSSDNMVLLTRNMSFLEDRRLLAAVARHAEDDGEVGIIWRTHILCWAVSISLSLPGDLVECGTYRGYSAAVLADYHDLGARPERRFYLYDTFNSSGAPGEGHKLEHHSGSLYQRVRERFAALPNVIPVQGRVPEAFTEACPEQICFLHVDLNDAAAERAALGVLYDRVVPRGVVIFDDYGWSQYRASRDAVREFMAERGQMVVELPTGQGMVIKT